MTINEDIKILGKKIKQNQAGYDFTDKMLKYLH